MALKQKYYLKADVAQESIVPYLMLLILFPNIKTVKVNTGSAESTSFDWGKIDLKIHLHSCWRVSGFKWLLAIDVSFSLQATYYQTAPNTVDCIQEQSAST